MPKAAAWIVLIALALPAAAMPASNQIETTLANGMRVLVRELPLQSLVTVEVLYAAGAAAEPDSLGGLAHLAEHLLCRHTARQQALLTLDCNAATSAATMSFTASCLPSLLPQVLDVEASRMRGVVLDSLEFDRERTVVLQELAYRGGYQETSTRSRAFRASFPDHPYGRSPGGRPETVARITFSDLQRFVAGTIHPGVAALIIDGPVDPPAVLEMVRTRFGSIASGPTPGAPPPYPPCEPHQVVFDDWDQEGYRLGIAVRVPIGTPQELVLADLAADYLEHENVSVGLTLIPHEGVLQFGWFGAYYRPDLELSTLYPFDPDQDVQRSLGWHWERVANAVAALAAPDRRNELLDWLRRATERRRTPRSGEWLPGTVLLAGAATPTGEQYARLAAAVTLPDLSRFLVENVAPGRATIAVCHGRDSERLAARQLAGRVVRHEGIEATAALADLEVAEIEPVLEAYGKAGVLSLTIFHLSNGIPVVCRHVPDDPRWTLTGWRRFEPIKDARPGKRAGICHLYGLTAAYDVRAPRDGRPPQPWRHDARFGLSPDGLYGYTAVGPAREAVDIAASLVGRLQEERFNVTAWTEALRDCEVYFARLNLDADARATAWRCSRVLGEDHPALAAWRPEARTLEKVLYKDLEKLHREAAGPTGSTVLLAYGGLAPEAVRATLEAGFGRREKWSSWTASPPPPGMAGIEGRIFAAPRQQDVTLSLTFAPFLPDRGWKQPGLTILLLEEMLTQALDSRLRQQEGWSYVVGCHIGVAAGWALPEIAVTCQPGQAPAILAVVRDELAVSCAGQFPGDRLALARLRLATRLLRSGDDVEMLAEWLHTVSAFGPVPADPVRALLALDPVGDGVDLAQLLPADRFVFSAVGAILEDELELFEP